MEKFLFGLKLKVCYKTDSIAIVRNNHFMFDRTMPLIVASV